MIDLTLPSLGPDMETGTLLEWRIAPGQRIGKGTIIAVVDTEKAAIDVESWQEGEVVELLAEPGQELAVGAVIARLAAPVGAPAVGAPAAAAPAAVALATAPTVRASPAARARAKALQVDLGTLQSRRADGVLTLEDVEAAARLRPAAETDRQASVRGAIAAAMTRSHREIPHYYLWEEVDVSRSLRWLETSNAGRPVTGRLLPAALLLAAVARAAAEFEDMNGIHDGTIHRPSQAVHLGVAVALRGGGLIAPALRDAQALPLDTLMARLSDLVARARRGGLRNTEVTGQTITVTHLGEGGCRGLLGVIHPPQVALVGIGGIGARAVVEAGTVVARDCITLSLAADHRVSDGRRGALFLGRIASLLQQPESL